MRGSDIIAIVLGVAVVGVIGYFIYRVVFSPMKQAEKQREALTAPGKQVSPEIQRQVQTLFLGTGDTIGPL